MSQSENKYLESLWKRDAMARKKERGQILDEYVQTTGYHRKYAIVVLSRPGQRKTKPVPRSRATVYTAEDARALEKVSDLLEGITAKRAGRNAPPPTIRLKSTCLPR